ncbi:PASTA domain-containing protein [Mycolicibacterium sp. Dal123E01]|uniref:PASTA domain-containing protein n=1 Tax=Mycolicibacterium sp. Dal123E01 TaxID=3457578 RepID=UPI00403ECC9F
MDHLQVADTRSQQDRVDDHSCSQTLTGVTLRSEAITAESEEGEVEMKIAALLSAIGLVGAAVGLAPPSSAYPWIMPNLIGRDLQGAQDTIQSMTNDVNWYSGSTDATGRGRMQIEDRNWLVCYSTPAPGRVFTENTPVNFGVVKKGEVCP